MNASSSWDFSHWVGRDGQHTREGKAWPHRQEQPATWGPLSVSSFLAVGGEGAGGPVGQGAP